MKKILSILILCYVFLPGFAEEKSWEYVDQYVFEDVNLNTSPKTFNNLQGDTYDYRCYLVIKGDTTDNVYNITFNGDTGTNYRDYVMYGTSTTATASVNDSASNISGVGIGDTAGNYSVLSVFTITGSSGDERAIDLIRAQVFSDATYINKHNEFWKNTTDEINSITFTASTSDAGSGEIYLFRRQKDSIYNASDWVLVEKQNISAQDMSGTPVIFSNLQGDVDKEYKLESELNGATSETSFTVSFNSDTTTTNYIYQDLINTGGTLTAATGDGLPKLNETDASSPAFSRLIINAISGDFRSILAFTGGVESPQQYTTSNWWENSADEINSITITASNTNAQTGVIRLYKRSTDRSTPSHEKLIADYDISGDFSSGNTFQNLDTNKMYRIDTSELISSSGIIALRSRFNGDTGSNYEKQILYGSSTTATASTSTDAYRTLGVADTTYAGSGSLLLFPKAGKYRPSIAEFGYYNTNPFIQIESGWWKNTADDLQDILVYASSSTSMTGNVKIWEIDLFSPPIVTWSANNAALEIKDDDLIWGFKCDESSGNRIDTKNSYVMTDQSSVGSTTGKINNGINYVASSTDYTSIALSEYDSAALFATKDFAFDFWVKTSDTVRRPFIGNDRFAANGFLIDNNGDDKVRIWFGGVSNTTGIVDIEDNDWHHIAVAINGTSLKCWFDNVLEIDVTESTSITDNSQALFIGAYNNGGSPYAGEYSNMVFDEFRLWDSATDFDNDFVDALYNDGDGVQYLGE
jgi:hypothetical protein